MRLETGSENLSFPNRAQCLLIKTHYFLLSRLKKNGVSEAKREQKIGTATLMTERKYRGRIPLILAIVWL